MSTPTTPKQDRLVALAIRFRNEIECPSDGYWAAVFYALATQNEEQMADLLDNALAAQNN